PPPDPSTYRRVFFVLIVTMACNGLVYTGMLHTIPKVFELGLSDVLSSTTNFFVMLGIETGNYTDLGLLVGGVIGLSSLCSIFGGWLADRYSAKRIYLIFWTLTIPPLFFVTSTSGMTLLAVVLLAMSFNVTFVAAENILVARYTPFKWRSLAYGARFVLALGVGGLTVRLAGNLYDQDGSFTVIYLLLAGGALLASLGALLLPRTPTHTSPVIP
ncbi:MAG TPA: MFS transporter, partial [Gammaproteobacteria bacterium]|nr:MFS transporter [Gammaproteobacteria bacterium]